MLFLSCAVSGRRYARAPIRLTICSAQARWLAAADVGRHEKIILRLGVSDTLVALVGPAMATSSTCGGSVLPALAVPFEARDQLCGLTKSSYGPSVRRTNAAETRCWPALILIGSVRM